jgi:hypothetical protein
MMIAGPTDLLDKTVKALKNNKLTVLFCEIL